MRSGSKPSEPGFGSELRKGKRAEHLARTQGWWARVGRLIERILQSSKHLPMWPFNSSLGAEITTSPTVLYHN